MSIDGSWIEGFVLDRHVISSVPIGYLGEHMQFDTTRSALGELVYQLKYRNGPLNDIVDTAVAFVNERWDSVIDCVVSPPPSLHRTKQPAVLIAAGIAAALEGRVHFVVVFNLTRFARDKYDHFALRSQLQSLGISLRSATEPIDDTSTGKLMEGMLAAFAQFDNDVRSDRTRAGMKAGLELGRWVFLAPIGTSMPRER